MEKIKIICKLEQKRVLANKTISLFSVLFHFDFGVKIHLKKTVVPGLPRVHKCPFNKLQYVTVVKVTGLEKYPTQMTYRTDKD